MNDQTLMIYAFTGTGAMILLLSILLFRSLVKQYKLLATIRKTNLDIYDKSYIIHRYNEAMQLYIQKESYVEDIITAFKTPGYSDIKHTEDIAMNASLSEKILDIYEEIAFINASKDQVKQS